MNFTRAVAWVCLCLASGALLRGADPSRQEPKTDASLRQGPVIVSGAPYGVGRLIPDLELQSLQGERKPLSAWSQGGIVVVAITNTGCPLSRKFSTTLAQLERDFQNRKVTFLFVNPTPRVSLEELRDSAREHQWTGPYVHDRDGSIARALGATHTTDAFVIDSQRTIVYRGAVDDQYGFGYALDAPRRRFLADALEATLQGRLPATCATIAPGCPLELQTNPSGQVSSVTYHARISRLLQTHCLECHRHGGVAPFALEEIDEVKSQAAAIQAVIQRGTMPPWFAAPPAAGEKSRWSNDRTLPAEDKADLLAWLAGSQPDGDPREAPHPRQFSDDWQCGTPDLIVQIPQPVEVRATGTMPYHGVVVETETTQDHWIQALEIQPTAREVVHHVLVFVLAPATGSGKREPKLDMLADNEQRGFFAAYVPGNRRIELPDDYAKFLPAGARLYFQIHYAPNGKATTDQTRLGMVFAQRKPEHVVQIKGIVDNQLNIPAGANNHAEVGLLRLAIDMRIMSFMPHMHLRGKAFRYEAQLPDGRQQLLLDIPHYDTNWQLAYRLTDPIELPKGTIIKATGWFDNSRQNPANPDPGKTVHWGQQVEDEMLVGYIEYYPAMGKGANPKGEKPRTRARTNRPR
ncbi:MAG: redoxin domain-containing protein [Planctomycetales bacterium]